MPATKGSRILTTRSLCHYDNDSSRSSGLWPSLPRTLTSRSRSEVGPRGQPAEQSVLFGQLAIPKTYARSRRARFSFSPDHTGWVRYMRHFFCRDQGRVHDETVVGQGPILFELLNEVREQTLPNTLLLPVSETSPTGHSRTAAQLQRQLVPRNSRPQDEQDSGQDAPLFQALAAPFGTSRRGWEQLLNLLPLFVAEELFGHCGHVPHSQPLSTYAVEAAFVLFLAHGPRTDRLDCAGLAGSRRAGGFEVVRAVDACVNAAEPRKILANDHASGGLGLKLGCR